MGPKNHNWLYCASIAASTWATRRKGLLLAAAKTSRRDGFGGVDFPGRAECLW
jgi:hypothetical protein